MSEALLHCWPPLGPGWSLFESRSRSRLMCRLRTGGPDTYGTSRAHSAPWLRSPDLQESPGPYLLAVIGSRPLQEPVDQGLLGLRDALQERGVLLHSKHQPLLCLLHTSGYTGTNGHSHVFTHSCAHISSCAWFYCLCCQRRRQREDHANIRRADTVTQGKGKFTITHKVWHIDSLALHNFSPKQYTEQSVQKQWNALTVLDVPALAWGIAVFYILSSGSPVNPNISPSDQTRPSLRDQSFLFDASNHVAAWREELPLS